MSVIQVSPDVEIAYETFGKSEDPAVLLVMGFGAQMLSWHEEMCQMLADRGRYVIRYDNRDVGLSTKWDAFPVDMMAFVNAVTTGDFGAAKEMIPYSLTDMAEDGFNLLSALGIERAHLVGASMGGMIAQRMAIDHPARVLTLTSMMSTTGEPDVGQATPEAQQILFTPKPADREGYISATEREVAWASKRYANVDTMRELAAANYDRSYYPSGTPRQLGAMILDGSRAEALAKLDVPTLVIHGLDDALIDPSGGKRTAELVPNATLMLVPDMGHDRPHELWGVLVDAIVEHTSIHP